MENRFYHAPGLNIERIARDLVEVFLAQGNQAQYFGDKGQTVVQVRKGGDFEAILGMQAALTIILQPTPGGIVATTGQQQWLDKAAVGTIGMLVLWPLLFTAGAGMIRQASLDTQVMGALDMVVRKQQPDVQVGPVPPQFQQYTQYAPPPAGPQGWPSPPPGAQAPQGWPHTPPGTPPAQGFANAPAAKSTRPAPATIQCSNCQAIADADDFYCSRCGKPLALLKKRCPQCQAEVKSDAAFCPRCGTGFPPAESKPQAQATPQQESTSHEESSSLEQAAPQQESSSLEQAAPQQESSSHAQDTPHEEGNLQAEASSPEEVTPPQP